AEERGRVELVLGLTAEVGSLAGIYKKFLRDRVSLVGQSGRLKQELGDVLWYVATIAESIDARLGEIAKANLRRVDDRYDALAKAKASTYEKNFDAGFPSTEVFPRQMLFCLRDHSRVDNAGNSLPHVDFSIERAEPNAFPNGKEDDGRKGRGFTLGVAIGDPVNDNALVDDGYRFHDAVHVAFMAVLGWSPVMRELLRVKRASDGDVNRTQDGARARDLEEALSAILKEMSQSRNNFAERTDIDGEVRDIIRVVVSNLEVKDVPLWLWASAIHQGYTAMNALRKNKGGWLLADMDTRTLTFLKDKPAETKPPA
ncbi:MAG: hypothetical protein ABMA14_27240, partial [Hyphomonadaceae bacterium]